MALLAALFAAALEAATAGDIDAARIAHEAAGKLLAGPMAGSMVKPDASPVADAGDALEGQHGAEVVDLETARAKRGGRS